MCWLRVKNTHSGNLRPHTHFHTHTVPYHAPFAALWGIYHTKQSIDNQLNNTIQTPKTMKKHTTQNGAIARTLFSPSFPHSHCALLCPICGSMGHLPSQTIN
jgi:hypothetical protein